jgi:hypothetical protein
MVIKRGKDLEGGGRGPLSRNLPGETEDNYKLPSLAKIQTLCLPNTSLEYNRYASLLESSIRIARVITLTRLRRARQVARIGLWEAGNRYRTFDWKIPRRGFS